MDDWARKIRARLVAHWPALGGDANDPAAKVRLEDWLQVIRRGQADAAWEALADLVENHGPFPPSIGEWQATVRAVATRHQALAETERRRAIEAGTTVDETARERIARLVLEARQTIDAAKANQPPPPEAPVRVSKYDKPRNIFWGEKRMTPEERAAELAAFGDRRVRQRNRRAA